MSRRPVAKETFLPTRHDSSNAPSPREEKNGGRNHDDEKFHKPSSLTITTKGFIWCRNVTKFYHQILLLFVGLFFLLLQITLQYKYSLHADPTTGSPNSFDQPRILLVNSSLDRVSRELAWKNFQSKSGREVVVSFASIRAENTLANSRKYNAQSRDPLWEGECQPMQWWQETSFPSCNKMHEIQMEKDIKVLAQGGYNTVFKLRDIDETIHVLKILEYPTGHTDRNLDRVRRDSLIMERTTRSKYVVDIYSFCGMAQVVEFGSDGNLENVHGKNKLTMSSSQKLQAATQVTQGLADVHNIDGDGISSMSHGDFAAKQYILIDGSFKLNDFNRGRFIRWNSKKKEPCTYTIGANDAKFRAPEEYKYIPETAAIDVWALGSIFVQLVTGQEAWNGVSTEKAQERIAKGKLPHIPEEVKTSTDPVDQVLLKAIDMCYVYEPKDRPKAGEVLEYMKNESKRLGIDWQAPYILKDRKKKMNNNNF